MKKAIFAAIFACLTLVACDEQVRQPTPDEVQRQAQQQLSAESNAQAGMPAITTFAEKKWMKMILEKRDDAKLSTTAYIADMQGHFHKVCDSLGYGLPYATQFTNPQRPETYRFGQGGFAAITLPQADPNGLFSPASADGTWVMCINPGTKTVDVQYIEEKVNIMTFKPTNAVD